MSEKNICMKCKSAGAKSVIGYKIIEDRDGQSVKFVGQLCDKCFSDLFGGPPSTKSIDENKKEN